MIDQKTLESTARALIANGKGILAADESTGTIKKRFDSIGAQSTPETRRDYREMLFRTEMAMRKHISGVILFDETLRQRACDGTPMIKLIEASGAIPGIKVDTGAHELALCPGEKITEGLDGLRGRFSEYYQLGARFAKWRAVLNIDVERGLPSDTAICTNAHALARYAACAQEANIVPIVEPELIMDGTHDIATCDTATRRMLSKLYDSLRAQNIFLAGTILKPNMIISASKCPTQADAEEIAERTIAAFRETVPSEVSGIVFLSGGQSDYNATANLDAMNKQNNLPWALSFSYGRALQAAPLKAWGGQNKNIPLAQAAFAHRAQMNGLATQGKWSPALEVADSRK